MITLRNDVAELPNNGFRALFCDGIDRAHPWNVRQKLLPPPDQITSKQISGDRRGQQQHRQDQNRTHAGQMNPQEPVGLDRRRQPQQSLVHQIEHEPNEPHADREWQPHQEPAIRYRCSLTMPC